MNLLKLQGWYQKARLRYAWRHHPWSFKVVMLGWGLTMASLPLAQPLAAAELQEIQQRGYLIVAIKDNLRPLGFRTTEGELQGFEIDIARQLAQELLGRPDAVVLQPVANQDRLSAVLRDDADLVIARVTATGSRARLVDFSTPYYTDGTAIVTRDSTIDQLGDLTDRTLAVLNGSTTIATVRSLFPNIRLLGVNSYEDALARLESGDAAAFAADASVLAGWVQEYPQYRLLPDLLSAEALCVVMPRGVQYDPLRQQINATIDRWWQTGWLQDRMRHWGLPQ
jgi:polar amino acid transport system substrate-binding protein